MVCCKTAKIGQSRELPWIVNALSFKAFYDDLRITETMNIWIRQKSLKTNSAKSGLAKK